MTVIQAQSLDGGKIDLSQETVDQLRGAMEGPLLLPHDPGYDEARAIWNAMIDRRPALICRCIGTSDVIRAVNFARENKLALCMRSGGHNIAGLAVADGALMIDQTLRRGVWVDREAGLAHAQGGCLLGDVDQETQLHGLAATLGFVSRTGIAGLTLGGGFGYLSRRFGWTSDTVESMEVVTADGKLVRASESENADLFWGLRGGGGNFGVVTSIAYRLNPVGPEIFGGAIAWHGDRADKVLELFAELTAAAPPEVTYVAGLRKAPPAPWIAKEAHGKSVALIFVCDTGPIAEAEQRARRLKSFGSPVGDVLQRRPYCSQQALLDATQPSGRRYYWKSEYLPEHDPEMFPVVIEQANRIASPHSAILLFSLGGAVGQHPTEHSPVGNRDAKYVVNVAGSWDSPDDDETHIGWARSSWEKLRRFSTGGTYLNFLTEEEAGARLQDAWGDNYARLIEIKSKWDPGNLFRMNKNIQPA